MRQPRTTLLAVIAALLAVLTAGGLPSAAAETAAPPSDAAPAGPRSLGVPLEDTLLKGGTVGTMADGHRAIWSASSGTPTSRPC